MEIFVNPQDGPTQTIGSAFASHCQTKGFWTGGKAGKNQTFTVEGPELSTRATLTASGASLTSIQKLPGVVGALDLEPVSLWDIYGQSTTTSRTIRFIKESSFTNAAAAVAEEGLKPDATLSVEEEDATVRKIAVTIKATDEMLEDHEGMRSFVDSRLLYSVRDLACSELLNGTGTGNRILGSLNVSGIQEHNASTSDNAVDGIQEGITKVRTVGHIEPTSIVLNAIDWGDFQRTKDLNGQYVFGGPLGMIYNVPNRAPVMSMWGLPVVSTTRIAQGTALVGNFRRGCEIFLRSVSIESTNSNEDDFKYNRIAIRAEIRLTLATYKPLAFCAVTNIA